MYIVLNSKFFKDLSARELGEKARALGYEGIDICVRPGHAVDLENVAKALPEAHRIWLDQGLRCPLATAPVSFTDAAAGERLYEACARAEIPRIKLGYWYYSQGSGYWDILGRARRELEGFAALSERYGVKSCCHTHSGACLGSNCAGAMHLVRDFDPGLVGVYPDFGHLALDGEDLSMGLSMISEYLTIVAVKDAYHVRRTTGEGPPHVPSIAPVGGGSVNWPRALELLADMGYDDALVVHTEYDFDESIIRQVGYEDSTPPDLEATACRDVAYLKRILTQMQEGAAATGTEPARG